MPIERRESPRARAHVGLDSAVADTLTPAAPRDAAARSTAPRDPAPRDPAPRDPAPRRFARHLACLLLAAALSAAAPLLAPPSHAQPSASESANLPFWDAYLHLTGLLRTDPDAVRAEVSRRTASDPDDFLGRWMEGVLVASAPADSARAARMIDTALRDTKPKHAAGIAGQQVAAGALLVTRGAAARGSEACRRAVEVYLARKRPSDAAHALVWPVALGDALLDPKQIDDLIQHAEQIARGGKDASTLGDVLNVKASQVARRDPRAAIAIRREVQALLQPLGPRFVQLANHRRLGLALHQLGEFDEAEVHYRTAAVLADTLKLYEAKAYCLSNLGSLQETRGHHDQAADLQRQAVAAAEQSKVPSALVMTLINLANVQLTLGHYDLARPSYERALDIATRAALPYRERLPALDALAMLDRSAGRLDAAIALWQSAVDSCRVYHVDDDVAMMHLRLAQSHLELGNLPTAQSHSQMGLESARRTSRRSWEVYHLVLSADLLLAADDPNGALQAARQATAIAREADPHFLTPTHHVTASALSALHRTGEAIALLDSVIAHFPAPVDSSDLAQVVAWQGNLCLRDGQPARSIALLERALSIERALGSSPPREAAVEIGLGRALLAAGRPEPAIARLESGLDGLERVRDALGLAEERRQYVADWYEGYVALACAHARRGSPHLALAALERCRANQTRELLGAGSPGLADRVSPALAREATDAQRDLAAAQVAWVRMRALRDGGDLRRVAVLDARLDSLRARWSELQRRIAREAPTYAREMDALPPATAAELQRWLGPRRRLVAYLVGQQAMLAFEATSAGLSVREIPWGERGLSVRVDTFLEALQRGDDAGVRAMGTALSDTLFAPNGLTGQAPEQLFVAADGPLHRVPFEALWARDGRGPSRYVIEVCPVTYVTSATLLIASTADGKRFGGGAGYTDATLRVVAFGDPSVVARPPTPAPQGRSSWRTALETLPALPHARQEVESLRAMFHDARVFVGDEATESRFFAEAAGAGIVHIAAHAFVDDRRPSFSSIVLAPSTAAGALELTDDGLVQADEVARHRIDAELVTLSACETGGGTLLRGEGIVGLARAFRVAGARNLVVSLWKVDDAATAAFMQRFYQQIAKGQPPAIALREAKLAMLKGRVGTHSSGATTPDPSSQRGVGRQSVAASLSSPSAWAPFVLFAGPARVPPRKLK
jgi:CHAT domain-containing protein